MKKRSKIQEWWEKARDDLGLNLEMPFDLHLENGITIEADLLVKNFGARNGMLIVTENETIWDYRKQVVDLGFGYSVLSDGSGLYDRESMIEMLKDWGWSGPATETPSWMS